MRGKRLTGYEFWLPVSALRGGRRGHCVILDGDKQKSRFVNHERKGGSGFGIGQSNVCFTLSTIDRHIIGVFH